VRAKEEHILDRKSEANQRELHGDRGDHLIESDQPPSKHGILEHLHHSVPQNYHRHYQDVFLI
jgi:hypothetical protein